MDLIEKLRKEREERRLQRQEENRINALQDEKRLEEERAKRRAERAERRAQVQNEVQELRSSVRAVREDREKKVETLLKESDDFDDEEYERKKREREAEREARAEKYRLEEEVKQKELEETRRKRDEARKKREEEERLLEEEREKARLEREKKKKEKEAKRLLEEAEREKERELARIEREKENEEREAERERQLKLQEEEREQRLAELAEKIKLEEEERERQVIEEKNALEELRKEREAERIRLEEEAEQLDKEREKQRLKREKADKEKAEEEKKERELKEAEEEAERIKQLELREKIRKKRDEELEKEKLKREAERKQREEEENKRRQEELKKVEKQREARKLEQERLDKEEKERIQHENELKKQREIDLENKRLEEVRKMKEEKKRLKDEREKEEQERQKHLEEQRIRDIEEENERKRIEKEAEDTRREERRLKLEQSKKRQQEAEKAAQLKREELERINLERIQKKKDDDERREREHIAEQARKDEQKRIEREMEIAEENNRKEEREARRLKEEEEERKREKERKEREIHREQERKDREAQQVNEQSSGLANKSAFMAQLAGKIGAGPPKKKESTPVIITNNGEPTSKTLTHVTKNRAKPTRNRRAPSTNPVRNRPGTFEESDKSDTETNTITTVEPPKKKLPPGARAGGLGGLIAGLGTISPDMLKKNSPGKSARRKEFEPRLIRIAGSRPVMVTVVYLDATSLADNAVFILDDKDSIYIWKGKTAQKMSVATAAEVSTRLNRENHHSTAAILNVRSGYESDKFWEAIRGEGQKSADLDIDLEYAKFELNTKLFEYDESSNTFIPIEEPRHRRILDSRKCYILDSKTEFYIWNGKKASMELRDECYSVAEQKFGEMKRPPFTEIERVAEDGESVLFTSKFLSWPSQASLSGGEDISTGNVAKKDTDAEAPDPLKMYHKQPPVRWEFVQKDDGKDGPVRIWYIEGSEKVVYDESLHGRFHSDKSYICMYNYGNFERFMIYIWQGQHASISDKGTSAGLTMELNNKFCKNAADTIRVMQYCETEHFCQLFSPTYITYDVKLDCKFFHVRGTGPKNIRTHQIRALASQLFSEDVFILVTNDKVLIWIGSLSCDYVQNTAQLVAPIISNLPISIINEGSESKQFWDLLGGKSDYINRALPEHLLIYNCHNTLYYTCDKLFGEWSIELLEKTKIYIFDAYDQVYVWFGKKSPVFIRKEVLLTAIEYVEVAPDDRIRNTPMYIFEGSEPLEFQRLFHGFQLKDDMGNEYGLVDELLDSYNESYTYEQLLDRNTLPETVDKTRLQDYLSDSDFLTVFGMAREEFNRYPPWKQGGIRKKVNLF